MTIGEKILYLRTEKNLTQKQLADICGFSQSALNLWENGKRRPKIEQLEKISKALDVSWNLFLTNVSPSEKGAVIQAGIKDMVDNMNFSDIELKSNIIESSIEITEKRDKYIKLYDHLNRIGQDKAIEQVELLTKIPEYQKEPPKE